MSETARDPFAALRRDVSYLGHILGEVLIEQEGPALFDLEETIRALSKARRGARKGSRKAAASLVELVHKLDTDVAERVARAFTHYFQLVNLAEQHHRVRRRREHAQAGTAQPGSLEIAFGELAARLSRGRAEELLSRSTIELVFTAHPSEAQRRTVLDKHRRLMSLIARRERLPLTPAEKAEIDRSIRDEVTTLWQTDEIRQEKPRVGDEVKNALFYLEEILFPLVPRFYEAMEAASERAYGVAIEVPTILKFGSWVGADMDGNPNVTPEVAIDTALAHASRVIELYVGEVTALGAALSQSTRRVGVAPELSASLEQDAADMPELARTLVGSTHHEPYRRKARFMIERLRGTRAALVALRESKGLAAQAEPQFPDHVYDGPGAFVADLDLMRRSLEGHRGTHAGARRVRALLRQVGTFGFHLARLDVRIPAEWVRKDARATLGLRDDVPLTIEMLESALGRDDLARPDGAAVRAIVALGRMRQLTFGGGAESLILSMTRGAEDMLSALLLAKLAGLDPAREIAIVPLFETLDDLDRAGVELERALGCGPYRRYLAGRGDIQEIMLGYSDSNKDAGIVGSSFALYRAQQQLVALSQRHGLALKIFHGRGGSIGRGGGPSQRAIASLPRGAVAGRFKLTEQGEVLGWKYLVPDIAERNLELTVAGVLAHSADPFSTTGRDDARDEETRAHEALFEQVAALSVKHYRALVGDPGFAQYFAATTPIEEIPRLNIGSRPTRRPDRASFQLEALRAIPWVFAWTQSRQMVPGWYGAGRSLSWLIATEGLERVRRMRDAWPFFASTLDAIAVSLAQADMTVAARYADLCEDRRLGKRLFTSIALDHGRAVRAIGKIFGRQGALPANSPLARSIELRNPYVDPLSFIQIELLKRKRAEQATPELLRAILLTINGIAGGLRSTG